VARLLLGLVAPAIDLDGHAGSGAVEVDDVWSDRVLATEAQAFHRATPNLLPQHDLGKRHTCA
jgi:hypothetical protein